MDQQTKLAPDVQALTADHPDYVSALQKNRSWNFSIGVLDSGTYAMTLAVLSETTVVPYFVSRLTGNELIIAAVPAMSWVGLYLPQILGAYLVHNLARRKRYIIALAWLERVAILGLFLVALGIGMLAPRFVLVSFLFAYFCLWAITGFLIPAYSDFYAKHIPRSRGFFYGVLALVQGFSGLLGAAVVRWRLATDLFPGDMQFLLGLALVVSLPAITVMHFMREIPSPLPRRRRSLGNYFREIPDLVREHPLFRKFLLGISITALGKMLIPFLAIYATQHFSLPASVVAVYTGLLLASQSLSALLWGYLGDRFGYRWIWLIYALLLFLQVVLARLATHPAWFYAIFVLVGMALGAEVTARPNSVYRLSPAADTPRFVGLANTVLALPLALGPLLAGALIGRFSYPLALNVGILIALVGILATLKLIVGAQRTTAHAAAPY